MNRNIVDNSFRALYGRPCWGVRFDRMLNLSMNFGDPSLNIREPMRNASSSDSETVRRLLRRRNITVRGDWWLWFYVCHWRLLADDRELATGSSSLRQIERAIAELDGQQLVAVAIDSQTGETRFTFDLGGVLHCRRRQRNVDSELWMLYKPRGYVLSAYGNGTISHQRAGRDLSR